MPGTLTPSQMFTHELNPLKGWPSPYAVDKRGQADSGVTGINAGSVCYISPSTGLINLGTINGYMGLFAFQGENEFDVNGDTGNIISQVMNFLVASGAYELETTEYVSGETFLPNDPLTANTSGQVATMHGGICDEYNIVGVCSETGPATNSYGVSVVRFWPVYCPQRFCGSSNSVSPHA